MATVFHHTNIVSHDPERLAKFYIEVFGCVRDGPDRNLHGEWIERGTSFLAGMEKYSGFQTLRPSKHAVVVGGGFIGLGTSPSITSRALRALGSAMGAAAISASV